MTPCKVYFSRKGKPDKVLIAKDDAEFAALTRIGWKLEESK